ncbi:hypothetical protein DYB37_007310 [Aphanomyces astaci]|uniref:Uncharacterized protein n=1 Tax=Aphanomyces astaci TaxID=112090 RepID=A0A3R6WYM2_APHAT|nr:hypothetical protein DYB35_012008 [Aphanomyces astaci]RHZ32293.1 hypothetical protein DYB37_007310 [Aphanomyces astaci]
MPFLSESSPDDGEDDVPLTMVLSRQWTNTAGNRTVPTVRRTTATPVVQTLAAVRSNDDVITYGNGYVIVTTPLFTTPDTASREVIKEQKEAMSARHVDKMKQLNANLNDVLPLEKDQIVERSTRRMRERRQKLQQQTKTFMEEAASHVQALHAKHATWRRAQLEATSQAS